MAASMPSTSQALRCNFFGLSPLLSTKEGSSDEFRSRLTKLGDAIVGSVYTFVYYSTEHGRFGIPTVRESKISTFQRNSFITSFKKQQTHRSISSQLEIHGTRACSCSSSQDLPKLVEKFVSGSESGQRVVGWYSFKNPFGPLGLPIFLGC
jgi:hypothetical protein